MDSALLFTLSLCWWSAAARSYGSDKPSLIMSDEVADGETLKIICTLPLDYGGGVCRLYRDESTAVFREVRESDWLCTFHLSSGELLGRRAVGSRVRFTCDYHLQQFVSMRSDVTGVTVTGTSPSPGLSVSRRFVSREEHLEVTCTPPVSSVSSCHFYRGQDHVARGPCSRNLTGTELSVWEKPTLLLPVNLTCRYYPHHGLDVRSEPSNPYSVFVVDVSQASTSLSCSVSVAEDQLAALGDRSWTGVGAAGLSVSVQVSDRNLTTSDPCEPAV